jgi:hypothetical protein
MYGFKTRRSQQKRQTTSNTKLTMDPRSILRRKGMDFDASLSMEGGCSDSSNSDIVGPCASTAATVNPSTGFGMWRRDDGLPGCRTCCERALVCWVVLSLMCIASTVSVILLLLDGRIDVWNPRIQVRNRVSRTMVGLWSHYS